MARGLASKPVLPTLPLRCDLILTSLYSVIRYYCRPREHYMLILAIEILFRFQGCLTISTLLSLYADA
jgi:hypothetical protein